MHPLLRYVLVGTPLAVLLFLGLSDFFTQWDGRAVSRRPAPTDDPAVFTVLVVTDDGATTEADWPADVVKSLALPVEVTGTPPPRIPETAVRTTKPRFAFYFTTTPPGAETQIVRTTSARSVTGAVVAWVLGLAFFNMWRSGTPWSWEAREVPLPVSQGGTLQTDLRPTGGGEPERPRRPGKGPPPPKPRRGGGKRR